MKFIAISHVHANAEERSRLRQCHGPELPTPKARARTVTTRDFGPATTAKKTLLFVVVVTTFHFHATFIATAFFAEEDEEEKERQKRRRRRNEGGGPLSYIIL